MEFTIDLKNYNPGGSVFRRAAARGIVRRGENYLLIRSEKCGEYKFPGGGVEPGETLEEALARELREETGYVVVPGSVRPYGVGHERRKGMEEDIMEMDSYYFLCEVEEEPGERRLDEYETEYGYQTVWRPLTEAIRSNEKISDLENCPWIKRDTMVMQALINQT